MYLTEVKEYNKSMNLKQPVSKSGVTGVYRHGKKWQSSLRFNKKLIHLGTFPTFDEAVSARKVAEDEYFKPLLDK